MRGQRTRSNAANAKGLVRIDISPYTPSANWYQSCLPYSTEPKKRLSESSWNFNWECNAITYVLSDFSFFLSSSFPSSKLCTYNSDSYSLTKKRQTSGTSILLYIFNFVVTYGHLRYKQINRVVLCTSNSHNDILYRFPSLLSVFTTRQPSLLVFVVVVVGVIAIGVVGVCGVWVWVGVWGVAGVEVDGDDSSASLWSEEEGERGALWNHFIFLAILFALICKFKKQERINK